MGNKVQFFKSFVSKIKGIFGKESNLLWEGASEKIATGTGRVISLKTGAAIANVEKGFIKLKACEGGQTVAEGVNLYRTYIPAEGSPLYGLVKSTTTYNSPQIGKGFEAKKPIYFPRSRSNRNTNTSSIVKSTCKHL